MIKHLILSLLAAAALPSAAFAASEPAPRNPAQLQAVLDCAGLGEDSARLQCYDRAAAALRQAASGGDILVIDREQARAARRQAFGLDLPSFSLFSRGADPKDAERLNAELADARQGGDGRWTLVTTDAAVWRLTDDARFNRTPKAGVALDIRKGALGSYFCQLGSETAVRCARSR